jgi:hypothetical protein
MKIGGNFLARSFLAFSAILRTIDPVPSHVQRPHNHESQVATNNEKTDRDNSKPMKSKKPRFPLSRGKFRRPHIQFEDGSYQVL